MDRRTFLSWVGIGGLASSLPIALAACQPQAAAPDATESPETNPSPATSAPASGTARADGAVVLGTVADLESQGFLQGDASFSTEAVLVVGDPTNPTSLHAVDSRCPHRDCPVEWQASSNEFVCPCHSSRFAADGTVTNGPATEALTPFAVSVEGTEVLVKPA